MDFVKFSLSGFDEFLIYAGLAIAFIYDLHERRTSGSRPTTS